MPMASLGFALPHPAKKPCLSDLHQYYMPLPLYAADLEGLPPLGNMTRAQLIDACHRLKLPVGGNKEKLIQRVLPFYCHSV
jgi:hypothetical protein